MHAQQIFPYIIVPAKTGQIKAHCLHCKSLVSMSSSKDRKSTTRITQATRMQLKPALSRQTCHRATRRPQHGFSQLDLKEQGRGGCFNATEISTSIYDFNLNTKAESEAWKTTTEPLIKTTAFFWVFINFIVRFSEEMTGKRGQREKGEDKRQRATGRSRTQASHSQPYGIWAPAQCAELNQDPKPLTF